MLPLRSIFLAATIGWTAVTIYLSLRQSAFVRRHRDALPSDFVGTCTIDEHKKAADYAVARERLARWEAIMDAALAIGWAVGGINLLYAGLSTVVAPTLGRGVAFLTTAVLVGALVSLPFEIYRAFALEHRFGFNRTTVRQFVVDRLMRGAISLALLLPLAFGVLFLMRTLTGLWWLWAWFAILVLMLLAPTIYVRFIAPRFNKFEPLAAGELRSRVETALARAGFRSAGLYTMDASRRTTHGNAYFIGFGKTKQIVLFDTLLARCAPEEIEAVVAHELGHYLYRHIFFGIIRTAFVLFLVFAAFGWLTKQPWLLPDFGVSYHDDALALFVCILLSSLAAPLIAPIGNWISRRNEYQADDYARRVVGVEPMVGALTRLARDNASTLTPDPLYSLIHHSHPTIPSRVRQLRAAGG